jgi:hypothetical protein
MAGASDPHPWFMVVHEAAAAVGPRLGRAAVKPGRGEVATPGWLPATRKGCVPHLTPDLLARVPHLDALQLPLQDLCAPSPPLTLLLLLLVLFSSRSTTLRWVADGGFDTRVWVNTPAIRTRRRCGASGRAWAPLPSIRTTPSSSPVRRRRSASAPLPGGLCSSSSALCVRACVVAYLFRSFC